VVAKNPQKFNLQTTVFSQMLYKYGPVKTKRQDEDQLNKNYWQDESMTAR
jgi:hypothetical protein